MNKKLRLMTRKIYTLVAKPLVGWYLRKERMYRYGDIRLRIPSGVFHPGFFYSTKFLLEYLHGVDLKNKTLLELGCGSGLISIRAAKQDAIVTASDISQTAVEALKENAAKNGVSIRIIHSNLFENIPQQPFDWIVINPPFYRGKPQNEAGYAWYAGEEMEYFENLFRKLKNHINNESGVLMILSEDGTFDAVKKVAGHFDYRLKMENSKRINFEKIAIYRIKMADRR